MSEPIVPQTRIRAEIRPDGSGVLDVNGTHRHIEPGPFPQTRTAIVSHAAEFAAALRRPIGVTIAGADGHWDIVVHPDGSVTDVRQLEAPAPEVIPSTPPLAGPPAPQQPAAPAAPAPAPAPVIASAPAAPSAPAPVVASAPAASDAPAFGQTGTVPPLEDATLASRDELPEVEPVASAPVASAPVASAPAPTAHGAQELPATHETPAPAPAAPSPALPSFEPPAIDDTVAAQPAPAPTGHPIQSVPGYDPLLDETVTRPPTAHPIASVPTTPGTAPAPLGYQPGQLAAAPQQAPGFPPASAQAPMQQMPMQQMPQAPAQPGYAPGELSGPMTADGRHSFLEAAQRAHPAQQGLRGAMTRMGLKMAPSQEELSERADERAVSQHWSGPRTIAVVNGKGGAGKTPTTVLLSAIFAQLGGGGVLAWDNNQTRGTLGWRTERGPHEATLLELLPQADRLLSSGAQAGDLAAFVHHQSQDKYDVLRSKPMRLAHENRIEPGDVDAIHAVASRYYRLIVIDSGNDESDPMWLRMIDHADQIVVATTTRADHAEAGALLLEALAQRDERSAILAKRSVVVVSQADPKASRQDVDGVIGGYGPLSREVVRIPFDQAIVDGHLRLSSLRPETRRAWLGAAAAVARGL
ncbi:AAA family ATPase [Agrococcus jejuensis]|uniref:MinD-like ATPase involved in chromosome partitioning or flagellar assembly n=1 Tax=Agrococcus jejuensis TaxID=399736 RepID=A0A1G8CQ00_9MICO|nr:AAA family ATPase [Agrococcus jejuensis]SDH47482.1 MinD-like ATPase involved in chromosome partitioning or flagellar assembly [Agrococcus jejuensis]